MKTKIILVNQTAIPSSFGCTSLFVNDKHILDADENNDHPVEDVAESLAGAFDVQVQKIEITAEQLARSIVKHDPQLKEDFEADLESDEPDFDEWCQGYNNADIIRLISDL